MDISAPEACNPQHPQVTLVIPTLNEEASIEACIASLLAQDYPGPMEILVLDGGSTDHTRAVVEVIAALEPTVRLVNNKRRLQSAACNLGAALASPRSSVLLRADAHALYPTEFVTLCVTALRQHEATSVVVPMRAVGSSGLQQVIAASQNSLLGNGGSAHRQAGRSGFVDHGHHAAFDLAFFRRVGGYDERFTHNEDAELDHRMRAAGGAIWMCGAATIDYLPRTTWTGLARQYFNHGRGRGRMLITHRVRPRLRQMAPVLCLLASTSGLALTPLLGWACLVPSAYAAACSVVGAATALRTRNPALLAMGPVAMTMHLGWATGFLTSIATWCTRRGGLPDRARLEQLEPAAYKLGAD